MSFFEGQINAARNNYNYFFIRLILGIFRKILKLSLVLIIGNFIDSTIINIMLLFYTFYVIYDVSDIVKYYLNIINDIKNTLEYQKIIFELDFNFFNKNFFKEVIKYGR